MASLKLIALFASTALAQNCPGVLHAANGAASSCCVGGTLYLSTCVGWPICQGPATTTTGPLSCATDIPVTVNNYAALIASASESLAASGTRYATVITQTGGSFSSNGGSDGSVDQVNGGDGSDGADGADGTDGADGDDLVSQTINISRGASGTQIFGSSGTAGVINITGAPASDQIASATNLDSPDVTGSAVSSAAAAESSAAAADDSSDAGVLVPALGAIAGGALIAVGML